MKLKKGQVWKEVDSRFTRHVEVVNIDIVSERAQIRDIKTNRKTSARVNRFNGRNRGYEFVCDDISLLPSKTV